jgi:hypothetical protein
VNRTMTVVGAMLLSWAAAVAGVNVQQDPNVDLASYATYAWSKGLTAARPELQKTIVETVEQQLQAKGLKPVADAPDLWVVTYAFGEDMTGTKGGFYSSPNWSWGVITTDARMISAGTLMVDLIDAREKKVVWRAIAQAHVKDEEQAFKKIQVVVPKMFLKFPEH